MISHVHTSSSMGLRLDRQGDHWKAQVSDQKKSCGDEDWDKETQKTDVWSALVSALMSQKPPEGLLERIGEKSR